MHCSIAGVTFGGAVSGHDGAPAVQVIETQAFQKSAPRSVSVQRSHTENPPGGHGLRARCFHLFCVVRCYECCSAWCSRLRALWSFLSSSQATSSLESAKPFKPASRMAESGTLCRGVYLGWWDCF